MAEQAATHIDAGAAWIRNAWTERRWSAFLGTGIELEHRPTGRHWFTGECREIGLEVNGAPVDHMALGAVEWSDECNPLGAVLVAEYHGGQPDLTVGNLLFHENPGMLRRTTVFNAGPGPVTVANPVLDRLLLPHCTVLTDGFTRSATRFEGKLEERALALVDGDEGLVVGIDGGGRCDCFAADPEACILYLHETRELEPGESWVLPDSFVVPFRGDAATFAGEGFGAFLRDWRALNKWEAETAAETEEHTADNGK